MAEPSTAEQSTLLLTIGPVGGLDVETSPIYLPEGDFPDVLNMALNEGDGAMYGTRGRSVPGYVPGTSIGAVAWFPRSNDGSLAPVAIVASQQQSSYGSNYPPYTTLPILTIYAVEGLPTAPSTVPVVLPSYYSPAGAGNPMINPGPPSFVQYQEWLFVSCAHDAYGQSAKIDQNLNCTVWQPYPSAIPAVAYLASGAITAAEVYWAYTYSTGTQETSPSTIVGPYNLVAQEATLTLVCSTDPQITTINIYRIDQILGQWLYVGSVANSGVTTTFVDNTPSQNVTGQALILARDPPAPFYDITAHQDRIWGFGYDAYNVYENSNYSTSARPSDLWYSNYREPWGFDRVNQVIPINDNSYGDIGVAVRSLGSVLVAFKSKSTWLVYGSSSEDIIQTELGKNLGCITKFACIEAGGIVIWLSNQGIMYFDGTNLQNISGRIHKVLKDFSAADLAAACAFFEDGMFWISFPTQQVTYGYHLGKQKWTKTTMYGGPFAYDLDDTSFRVGGTENPGASSVVVGGCPYPQVPGNFAVQCWAYNYLDNGIQLPFYIKSRILDDPERPSYFIVDYIEIEANEFGRMDYLTVIVTANPGTSNPQVYTRAPSGPFAPGQCRTLLTVPPNIQGSEIQVEVMGDYYGPFELQRVRVYGRVKRTFNPME